MASELVEHTVIAPDLLQELLDASKGNFRRITTGLASIEKFAKSNSLNTIDADQWAGRQFFLSRSCKYVTTSASVAGSG